VAACFRELGIDEPSSHSTGRAPGAGGCCWRAVPAASVISDPLRPDAGAAGQPFRSRLTDLTGQTKQAVEAAEAEAIDDLATVTLSGDEAAVPQAGEVGADPCLTPSHRLNEFGDRLLPQLKGREQPQPRRVGENPEEPRQRGGANGGRQRGGRYQCIWHTGYDTARPSPNNDPPGDQRHGQAAPSPRHDSGSGRRQRRLRPRRDRLGERGLRGGDHRERCRRRVALVEAHTVGGTCVNVGCVPSKALLAAARDHWRAGHHPFAGIATSAGAVDMGAVVEQKNGLVDALRKEKYLDLADDYGFTIIQGHARLQSPTTVVVGDRPIHPHRVIIASGVEPSIPPIEGLTDVPHLTSTSALELTVLPEHLIVIGANAIGLELGQAFLHLGAPVTFLEAAPTVAPMEEPEVIDVMAGVLADEGAVVRTGVTIRRVTRDGEGVAVELEATGSVETVRGSHLLVATGRRPRFTGMGLDDVGVDLDDRGFIRVDEELRTTAPGVLAAGDVAGLPQFVYVAARSGDLAARNAFAEQPESLDLTALPRIVFTTPQIVVAGMTDEEANRHGYTCECRVLPLTAVPRALVNHDTRGVVKIVADAATRKVLGVSMVAEGAGDVILAAVYAIKFGITVEQMADAWGPYLTMGEALKLAAQTFTRDVSKLSCCAA
jgi:mercuric reductase